MKVAVTGASGMTGSELARQARARGWECAALTRAELDITDAGEVERLVTRERPDVIVNAAAFTAVDAAESAPEEAMAVNCTGAGNVARAAELNGAALVHISTDYVFDGTSSTPYRPDDGVSPLGVYGESKLAGEIAVREECERHAIVRTSWVYSHEGKNFVRTMLKAAGEGRELRVVNDQHGSPTSATDLGRALICVAQRIEQAPRLFGTYHFCNEGSTTWYEFAKAIFEIVDGDGPTILPVTTEAFPTAARRPRWSVLDTGSFVATFGMTPRPWRDALADTLSRMS